MIRKYFRKLFHRRKPSAVRRGDYRSVLRPRRQYEVLCGRELAR